MLKTSPKCQSHSERTNESCLGYLLINYYSLSEFISMSEDRRWVENVACELSGKLSGG